MKIRVDLNKNEGKYVDPTQWQNSTLRYSPPENFPEFLEKQIGRPAIHRAFVTLDEYWDYKTDKFYPDYDIGVKRYPDEELHYTYDWRLIVPAPSGTKFVAYLTSHAKHSKEVLLNVRRLEREALDGVISLEKYGEIFSKAVEYCKELAPNIRYIEVTNEPTLRSFGALTPAEFVTLYKIAYREIKKLNEKHNYEIPLLVGGNSHAGFIGEWDKWEAMLRELAKADLGDAPMDFYSVHSYDHGASVNLFKKGEYDVGAMGGVEKAKVAMQKMHKLLCELGLPEKPIFYDEVGRTRTTGIDLDALRNAAGVITYMIASGTEGLENLYWFPWCTFHNPKLQISFTQFLLNEDGSYSATPNGIAIMMMHRMQGDRFHTEVSETYGQDVDYRAICVASDKEIWVTAVNMIDDVCWAELSIEGVEDGRYLLERWSCNAVDNNVVTGNGDGTLALTASHEFDVSGGVFEWKNFIPNDGFVQLRLTKCDR